MTYTEMIQQLDKRYGYNSKNMKPVRRLNESWQIIIKCDSFMRFNKNETIYAPTAETAKKKADTIIQGMLARINKYNAAADDIDKVHILNIHINITDRDNNKRTIIIQS